MNMENMHSDMTVKIEAPEVLNENQATAERIISVEQQIFNLKRTSNELLTLFISEPKEAAEVKKIAENQLKLIEELTAEWKTLVKQFQVEGGDLRALYNNPN